MSQFTVQWNDKELVARVLKGAVEGLEECAQDLSERSQRLCPKERGYNGGLVSTHYEEVDAETLSASVGYTADHALRQHYGRRYKHKGGEQAMYLSQPLDENGRRYLQVIAEAIRRKLGS
jgi:hypothetical protein